MSRFAIRPAITNVRHIALLERARTNLVQRASGSGTQKAVRGVPSRGPARGARELGEVVGTRTSEDVFEHIFERFCIGK